VYSFSMVNANFPASSPHADVTSASSQCSRSRRKLSHTNTSAASSEARTPLPRLAVDLLYSVLYYQKGSPYSITERRVPEMIQVLGSQPAGDVSHKPGGRLPLLSARPAVTHATLERAATNFATW